MIVESKSGDFRIASSDDFIDVLITLTVGGLIRTLLIGEGLFCPGCFKIDFVAVFVSGDTSLADRVISYDVFRSDDILDTEY